MFGIPVALSFRRDKFQPLVKVNISCPIPLLQYITMTLDHIIEIAHNNNGFEVNGEDWMGDKEFYPILYPSQKIAANIMLRFTDIQELNKFLRELTQGGVQQ